MSESQFFLPDVGEGLTEAEIVAWKVSPGDSIEINQVVVEIETAKSLVELPSPYAGTVTGLLANEGDLVQVGTPIITVEVDGDGGMSRSGESEGVDLPSVPPAGHSGEVPVTLVEDNETGAGSASAVLVGYGTSGTGSVSRRRRQKNTNTSERGGAASETSAVLAKPPVRKLAKDLGVDLAAVNPTGLRGEITRDDVIRGASQVSVFRNIETPEWPQAREDRIAVKGVRRAIAQAMVGSAFTAPHVSLFVDVDATRTMEFVKRLKGSVDFAGVKVSPLLIMAKAIIWAVRRNSIVNSTWTDKEIIVHHFVNLGVAAATPRGLMVPNVKEAQAMNTLELARALEELTLAARDGKTTPSDMKDGTITVTNIGVFGMDTGTPILNPGEVAIVAMGAIKQKPWVVDGSVQPRFVTTIGASFDHRVVDGDVASRFVADVASIIEEPALLLE